MQVVSAFYMGVSKNSGTPKWMVYTGNPYLNGNHPYRSLNSHLWSPKTLPIFRHPGRWCQKVWCSSHTSQFPCLKARKKTVGLKKEPVYTVYASGIFFVWKNKWDTRVTFLSWWYIFDSVFNVCNYRWVGWSENSITTWPPLLNPLGYVRICPRCFLFKSQRVSIQLLLLPKKWRMWRVRMKHEETGNAKWVGI